MNLAIANPPMWWCKTAVPAARLSKHTILLSPAIRPKGYRDEPLSRILLRPHSAYTMPDLLKARQPNGLYCATNNHPIKCPGLPGFGRSIGSQDGDDVRPGTRENATAVNSQA
jgi:hypothetical protein